MSATRFEAGQMVMTSGVEQLGQADPLGFYTGMADILGRHLRADFGDLSPASVRLQLASLNDADPQHAERMMSIFPLLGTTVWIITEWDRSYTTVLLPSEY